MYKIANGPEQLLWETEPEDRTDRIRHQVILPLEDLDLTFHQAITYYAFAVDNREPNPQREATELQFLDIRPFRREYEFRESNCSGQCQGECLTLEKLIKEQRKILKETFSAERDEAVPQSSRLGTQEQELWEQTESLRKALLEKVGIIPPLDFAAASMQHAVKALKQEQLSAGREAEESALANLLLARENLRKILKQSSSQAEACKEVDRREQQKFRPPEKKTEDQKEQLAEIRKQMEELAKQQRNWSKSAKACSRSSSSSISESSESQPSESQSSNSSFELPKSQQESRPDSTTQAKADEPQSEKESNNAAREADERRQGDASNDQPEQDASEAQSVSENEQQPSRDGLAQQQQRNAQRARQLQGRLASGSFGSLAQQRVAEVADRMERSGKALERRQDQEAMRGAEGAADELERLSEHLATRHHPDFAKKLQAAAAEAQRLAADQHQLANSLERNGSANKAPGEEDEEDKEDRARRQSKLASRGEELTDLVEQIQEDAVEQSWEVQREISRHTAAHPPREAAGNMNEAVRQIRQESTSRAARLGRQAARNLQALFEGLEQAKAIFGQAQLEQLIEAEKEAAELAERMERSSSDADRALTETQAEHFAESLKPLAAGDKELNEAAGKLRQATRNASHAASASESSNSLSNHRRTDNASNTPSESRSRDDRDDEETEDMGLLDARTARIVQGLRIVDQVLQRRIQEAILSGVLQQSDDAVPAEYKGMVDDYYRRLSEDIE